MAKRDDVCLFLILTDRYNLERKGPLNFFEHGVEECLPYRSNTMENVLSPLKLIYIMIITVEKLFVNTAKKNPLNDYTVSNNNGYYYWPVKSFKIKNI